MSTRIKIWQVWDDADPAGTDSFCPTKHEAKRRARNFERPESREVEIVRTRQGICSALEYLPNR